MARTLARPAKIETRIRNQMEGIYKLIRLDNQYEGYLPPRRARHIHTEPDLGITVKVFGPSPLQEWSVIEYDGPLGYWQATINQNGIGKPRC
jgi:hypothetical protein